MHHLHHKYNHTQRHQELIVDIYYIYYIRYFITNELIIIRSSWYWITVCANFNCIRVITAVYCITNFIIFNLLFTPTTNYITIHLFPSIMSLHDTPEILLLTEPPDNTSLSCPHWIVSTTKLLEIKSLHHHIHNSSPLKTYSKILCDLWCNHPSYPLKT